MGLGLKYLKEGSGDCFVIFIHGVLSDGEKCWRHPNGTYWPDLLVQDKILGDLDILVYTYETNIFSAGYNLDDVVADLRERMRIAAIEAKPRIVFVCHSMGGAVARRYLVRRQLDGDAAEIRTTFGLFLVASPSLGSKWADWLQPIAEFLGHDQADALRFSAKNGWLRALDIDFQALIASKKEELQGRELIEDKFIVGGFFFAPKVVERISAARHFPNPLKIAGSDHSSIAKPESTDALQHQALRAFIKSLLKPKQLDPAAMVQKVNDGLRALIAQADEPVIREKLGRFRAAFENANTEIVLLKKYKGLHDNLHNLQIDLDAIDDALDRPTVGGVSSVPFGKYADDLELTATRARKEISNLPGQWIEESWVQEFETYAADVQRVARPAPSAADLEQLAKTSVKLRHLLGEAPRINQALTNCMANLRLGPVSEALRVIAEQLRKAAKPGDKALQQLETGSAALNVLRYTLEDIVEEHFQWQWFNNELNEAAESSKFQPQERLPHWKQFQERFIKLCDLNPNEKWATHLKDRLAEWIAATSSSEPGETKKLAGENAFETFRSACFGHFYEVNRNLKELSQEISGVAGSLNTLLISI